MKYEKICYEYVMNSYNNIIMLINKLLKNKLLR